MKIKSLKDAKALVEELINNPEKTILLFDTETANCRISIEPDTDFDDYCYIKYEDTVNGTEYTRNEYRSDVVREIYNHRKTVNALN